MNKSLKVMKKMIVLVLVLLFSLDSFAAVVGSDDGAAFVTKKEFEELKENFQIQIDKYNDSIDNKIDGAIANYLDGVRVKKPTKFELIYAGDSVNFMNGVIAPEFRIPRYMCNTTVSGRSAVSSNNLKQFAATLDIKYPAAWGTNETQMKPLIKLKKGSEDDIQEVYWDGIALRYLEKVVFSLSKGWQWSDLANFDLPYGKEIRLSNGFQLLDLGYNANIENTGITSPTMTARAQGSSGGSYYDNGAPNSTPWSYAKTQLAVDLEPYGDVTKDHVHVIQYDGSNQWEVYNELFVHSLRLSSAQTLTDANVWSTVNTSTYRSNTGFYIGDIGNYGGTPKFCTGSITFTVVTTTNKLASIGLLPTKWRADNIYQAKEDWKKTYTKDWEIKNLTLQQGMPAFAAESEEEIEWDVYFPSVYCTNNGSTYVENQNEVDIYVSKTPFINGVTVTEADDLFKFKDDNGVERNYKTTKDRKAKLKWEIEDSGPVYVKCVPHWEGTSYINSNWDIEMTLEDEYKTVNIYR